MDDSEEIEASFRETKEQQKNQRIQELLSSPEVIDLNSKKSEFLGSLIICPTPVGNIKDMSLRVYNALHEVDVIVCEDTRFAGKLFIQMNQKDIGNIFSETWDIENKKKVEEFEEEAKKMDSILEQDKKSWEKLRKEHPNLWDLKRDKQKLKDHFQDMDIKKMKARSNTILKNLDTMKFLNRQSDYPEQEYGKPSELLYDTRNYRRKTKISYG